jgi:hypothetical protein
MISLTPLKPVLGPMVGFIRSFVGWLVPSREKLEAQERELRLHTILATAVSDASLDAQARERAARLEVSKILRDLDLLVAQQAELLADTTYQLQTTKAKPIPKPATWKLWKRWSYSKQLRERVELVDYLSTTSNDCGCWLQVAAKKEAQMALAGTLPRTADEVRAEAGVADAAAKSHPNSKVEA